MANYELLQEENKLLLQEREFYFDQKLKKIMKENEDLRGEVQSLKDMIKHQKQSEINKIQELEKAIFDRQQKEEKDKLGLSDRNDELQQLAQNMKAELDQSILQ